MKKLFCLSLLALTTGAFANAATLTHRYDFEGDTNDSVGTLNDVLNVDGTAIEAPLFNSDVPTGADSSFANTSIEFGITIGHKISTVNFVANAQTQIYNASAGSFNIALDGNVKTHSFTAGALSDPARLILGNFSSTDISSLDSQFDGSFYNFQIYDGVLTSQQIGTLASNAGTVIPEPGTYALIDGILALTSAV